MRFRFLLVTLLFFGANFLFSQDFKIYGTVNDADTGEPLIGATIVCGQIGTVSDFDGNYEISLPAGKQELIISYVGFNATTHSIEVVSDKSLNFKLSPLVLNEVVVVADIVKDRETPVAFSTIPALKMKEELGSQEMVMLLNSTPGAYATQSGGGDGDARITIRGFNQRNVAVMIDGIPVNDMENGWVFWSNWFGLGAVTQTMQVQRGLGASKLSIPSIGGTINILTKGIDSKRSINVKQEFGNNGFLRTDLGLTTGRLKNGWGVSLAGSYKQGDGWVDGNFTEGWFYYLRLDKQLGNHYFSLQGYGAPQKHGQRSFKTAIGMTDSLYARNLDISVESINTTDNYLGVGLGRRFNQHWGMLDGELLNTASNFYHKPQFSLRHSVQASPKLFWSNIGYLSIGTGGGTATEGRFGVDERGEDRLIDLDRIAEANRTGNFLKPEGKSERIIRASNNDHFWYGLLSTLKYDFSDNLSFSGGVDGRYYRGDHYRTVHNLLGGDYFTGVGNARIDQAKTQLTVGDRYDFNNSGFVQWLGGFGLVEWKNSRWSSFINVSSAVTGYSMEDYFKSKVVTVGDTTVFVNFSQNATVNGTTYTLDSPEAKNQRIDWIYLPSFTIKGGAGYKLNKKNHLYANTGYINKAQRFTNVINDNRNSPLQPIKRFSNFENERIYAIEGGYSFTSSKFSSRINTYFTIWENKPLDFAVQANIPGEEETVPVNIPGIDALHKGIEIDFAYKLSRKLKIEGLVSLGDWIWNSSDTVELKIDEFDLDINYAFDAKGVHVGGAAQNQFGLMLRYEPFKKLYLRLNGTYFGRNFSEFDPEDLRGTNGGRESWQMPDYFIANAHAGYSFKLEETKIRLRLNIFNLLDATYISDAQNNDERAVGVVTNNFDAASASVHFGQGRRWTFSVQAEF